MFRCYGHNCLECVFEDCILTDFEMRERTMVDSAISAMGLTFTEYLKINKECGDLAVEMYDAGMTIKDASILSSKAVKDAYGILGIDNK